MINFNNKKKQRLISGIIAGVLAFAMIIGLLVNAI